MCKINKTIQVNSKSLEKIQQHKSKFNYYVYFFIMCKKFSQIVSLFYDTNKFLSSGIKIYIYYLHVYFNNKTILG